MGGLEKAPETMMIGWGEGLDQAARYLNAKPNVQDLKIRSWYPIGPFSFFFNGRTIIEDFAPYPDELKKSDYYVLYAHQWQRQLPSKEFVDYFDRQTPEHVIYLNGLDYARLYRWDEMQPNLGPE